MDSQIVSQLAEANGIRIHYLVAGKGDPIVLLHGFAETSHMWRPLIVELAKNHTVIAPDLRGTSALKSIPMMNIQHAVFATFVNRCNDEKGYFDRIFIETSLVRNLPT